MEYVDRPSRTAHGGAARSRPGRRRGRLALVCGLAVSSATSSAFAETNRSYALDWLAGAGAERCGDSDGLARAVEERLGRRVFAAPAPAEVTIEVRVERSRNPSRWGALVTLRGARGEVLGVRRLESEARECGPLRDALALAIALMIDPDAALSHASSPPPPPPVASVSAAPSASAPSEGPPSAPPVPGDAEGPARPLGPEDARRGRFELGAGMRVASGLLPSAAAGAVLMVAFVPARRWAIEAYGAAWTPESAAAPRSAAALFTLVLGGVRGCAVTLGPPGGLSLDLCAGAEAGALHVRGERFDVVADSTVPTVDLSAGARLAVPLGARFSARAGASVGVPLVRDQFSYEDASGASRSLYRRPAVAENGEIGVMMNFP